MRATINSLVSGVLVWLLVLTGQGVAFAQGANAAVGQMVICTGAGPVTVYVDAEGQPVGKPHSCPDCLVFGEASLHPRAQSVDHVDRLARDVTRGPAPTVLRHRSGFLSRAPPRAT